MNTRIRTNVIILGLIICAAVLVSLFEFTLSNMRAQKSAENKKMVGKKEKRIDFYSANGQLIRSWTNVTFIQGHHSFFRDEDGNELFIDKNMIITNPYQ